MAVTLLVAVVTLSVFGSGVLLTVFFAWKHVQPFYQDAWAKIGVEAVQVLTGAVAIGGSFAVATSKTEWLDPAIAGAVCLALFKTVQLVADYKAKRSQALLELEVADWKMKAERAEAEGVYRTQLLSTLRTPVLEKRRRVERELADLALRHQGASIKNVRRALHCKEHLEGVLFDLAVFLNAQLPQGEQAHYSFRVGLYMAQGRIMRPLYGVKSSDPNYNPFTSHRRHEQFFRLDTDSPTAHTVRCVREQSLLIVSDCAEAKNRGELVFFNEQQPAYLKSLAACYIGKVCGPDGEECEAALVLDTDKAGYFKRESADSLRFTVDEFAARVALELSLLKLVCEKKRVRHDDATKPRNDGQESETASPTGESPSPGDET